MLIASKLPPERLDRTYFSSGRAAFSFVVGMLRPSKVYLPTFTCWSLVAAMDRRFPNIELVFYPVDRELNCTFPDRVEEGELLVFIHYFGAENRSPLPESRGVLLEDVSHSFFSRINPVGDHVFGSLRKVAKVADGGFVDGFFNPIYESGRKLDAWLRYEATDWRDMREAENMIDRDWKISDISSQSLAVLLSTNGDLIRKRRQTNERFLADNLSKGERMVTFRPNECPLIHNRLMESAEVRDDLRAFLAGKGVFTSVHWPTHDTVKEGGLGTEEALWIESHVISYPVSHDYGVNDMEYIASCEREWLAAGG